MLSMDEIQKATPDQARVMLREVTSILPVLVAKASEPDVNLDRLLSVEEAARMLHKAESWIYRRVKTLPFIVRDGRSVGCSLLGIQEYIRRRSGGDRRRVQERAQSLPASRVSLLVDSV